MLRGAPAIGALCTSVYLARRPIRHHAGRFMLIAVGIFGVATVNHPRAEGAPATGGPVPNNAQESRESRAESNGAGKTVSIDSSATEPAPRAVGNAALARRFAGPG